MTGTPLIDAMLGVITAAFYAIVFAIFFIVGFSETASTAQWIGLF